MTKHTKQNSKALMGLRSLALIMPALIVPPVQAIDLNYESLSSLEEPLAFDYQDITFMLNGLIDAAMTYQEKNDTTDSSLLGNVQLGAETQLANSWTLGAAYFGEYSDSANDYIDNAAIYLGGVWGTGSMGNVTGLVREQTRRLRGVGNADLDFDDQLGQLGDYGIAYIGRYGPTQLLITIDEDNGFEVGGTYQRPLDNKDYRFTWRYRDSEFTPDTVTFDSQSIGLVAELTYGSTIYDAGIGLEELNSDSFSVDRRYASFGASRKIAALTFSGAAHFGDTGGETETSYSVGLKYDVARGMSLNFGLNHSSADININGTSLLSNDDTEATVSLRYSF